MEINKIQESEPRCPECAKLDQMTTAPLATVLTDTSEFFKALRIMLWATALGTLAALAVFG